MSRAGEARRSAPLGQSLHRAAPVEETDGGEAPLEPSKPAPGSGWPGWSLAALAFAYAFIVSVLYVSGERAFYFYDYFAYQAMAHTALSRFQTGFGAGWAGVVRSLGDEYNELFAVPLLPALALARETRIVFVTSMMLLFVLPFALTLGGIARYLLPERPRLAFWSVSVLALLSPTVLVPTLRGMPDTVAALCMAVATLAVARDIRLRTWWQIPLLGLAVAMAMVFRRHYIYAGVAVFLAAGITNVLLSLWQARLSLARSLMRMILAGLRLALAAGVVGIILFTVARPFLERSLSADYWSLYAGYYRAPDETLNWFLTEIGWMPVLFGLAGLVAAFITGVVRREVAAFLALTGGVSLALWILVVGQRGSHYALHFTPAIVMGLAMLFWTLWLKAPARARLTGSILLTGFVVANLALGLASPTNWDSGLSARALLARGNPPMWWADYDEITRLIGFLRQETPAREPVYVVSSSNFFNLSVIRNGEILLYGWPMARLNLLTVPEVDSRDSYPLETLLRAEIVVLANPLQTHLGVENQRVVEIVHRLFTTDHPLARDFTPLDTTFHLDRDVTVMIYRRARPTSVPVAVDAYQVIRAAAPQPAVRQPDWTFLRQAYPSAVFPAGDGAWTIATHPGRRDGALESVALYTGQVTGEATLTGEIAFADPRCVGAALRLAVLDDQRRLVPLAETRVPAQMAGPFRLDAPVQAGHDLFLVVTALDETDMIEHCALRLDRTRLTPVRP